ncbi:MAG: hypothetical protein GXY33_10355 [Phycisphaerae bacterium]|nr:hypothetical protein [Phycisphaerae bacterium]
MHAVPDDKNVTILMEFNCGLEPEQWSVWMIPISGEGYEERGDTRYFDLEGAMKVIGPLPRENATQFRDALVRMLKALGYRVHEDMVADD